MTKKIINFIFIIVFLIIIYVPLVFTNFKQNVVSETENRYLTNFPSLFNEDKSLNTKFIKELESWFNDNVGFRIELVRMNANIQYKLFNRIERNDMHLGPNNELNYATNDILKDYQHLNLKSEDELTKIANGYQVVSDYLNSKGIQYYYMQCWDKHSIYPEYFSNYVNQYGEISKTDQIVNALESKTNINLINFKDKLISEKENYDVYSKWGDPTHWTQRGAYIGYLELMNAINLNNGNKYKVLSIDNYEITLNDQGENIFGSIHEEDLLEKFRIIEPKAIKVNSKLTLYSDDERHSYYVNKDAKNDTRVLILGDSYMNGFIEDDIAESFSETILIWGDYTSNLLEIIDTYKPDIVISESAERVERSNSIIKAANSILELEK